LSQSVWASRNRLVKAVEGGLGFVGLHQVNLSVPNGVTPGDSVAPILSVAGQPSVPVTMAVH
jgi:uncharacterized protein (TIGR03437 family)